MRRTSIFCNHFIVVVEKRTDDVLMMNKKS